MEGRRRERRASQAEAEYKDSKVMVCHANGSSLNDNVSNDTTTHIPIHKRVYVTYCINYILSAGMLNHFNCV